MKIFDLFNIMQGFFFFDGTKLLYQVHVKYKVHVTIVTCPEALTVVMRTSGTDHTPEQIFMIVFRFARFPNCSGLIQGGENATHLRCGTPCVNIN